MSVEIRLVKKFVNPSTSIWGSLLFAFIWVISGLIADYTGERVEAKSHEAFTKWTTDILGHTLVLGALIASFGFSCYGPSIRRILPDQNQVWSPEKERFLRFWFRISLVVMLGMTVANFVGVSLGKDSLKYWSHQQLPYFLPLAIASSYYLFTLLPLFLCLLNLSQDLERASKAPTQLIGFSATDHQKCFGISVIGNALVVSIFIFLYFLVVPIIVQANFYEEVSPGSIFAGVFSFIVFRKICVTPLSELQKNLGAEQLALLEEKTNELATARKIFAKNMDYGAFYEIIQKERQLIAEQHLIPFLKPFAFLGAFVVTASVVVSASSWFKKLFE